MVRVHELSQTIDLTVCACREVVHCPNLYGHGLYNQRMATVERLLTNVRWREAAPIAHSPIARLQQRVTVWRSI